MGYGGTGYYGVPVFFMLLLVAACCCSLARGKGMKKKKTGNIIATVATSASHGARRCMRIGFCTLNPNEFIHSL
jgi:hypothetical protein